MVHVTWFENHIGNNCLMYVRYGMEFPHKNKNVVIAKKLKVALILYMIELTTYLYSR